MYAVTDMTRTRSSDVPCRYFNRLDTVELCFPDWLGDRLYRHLFYVSVCLINTTFDHRRVCNRRKKEGD
jgi:hypothetical protein